MTTAYQRAIAFSKVADRLRRGTIDESWLQGRGSFGGILAAATLASMMEDVSDSERVPRSLTIHFCAPAAGALDLRTEVVRVGSRVTHAVARLEDEKGVTTVASASFCKHRPAAARYALAKMPEVVPAAALVGAPGGIPGIPPFLQHMDVRFCGPTMPFSSSAVPSVAAWVRMREPSPLTAPLAVLLVDTLPAAICATFAAPRPIASIDFTVHFFEELPERPANDEHLLVAITSRWANDGYTEELRDLWSREGVLLAQCRQLIALL